MKPWKNKAMNEKTDFLVIGAGIVGLATAWHLSRLRPAAKITILEKESNLAQHQSSHNSGVIHAGVYYKPGSAKARNCLEGYRRLLDFCDEHQVEYRICGKLITAVEDWELPKLESLKVNAEQNGLTGLKVLQKQAVREIEPHLNCKAALWVPQTGVIAFAEVCRKLADLLREHGAEIHFNKRVQHIRQHGKTNVVLTDQGEYPAGHVVNCAGLYADKLAYPNAAKAPLAVVPFRGEYYVISEEKKDLVQNLVYPVPNPELPFLGVHFTRRIDHTVDIGPNAVLAFAREGYKFSTVNASEMVSYLRFPGFWKMAGRFWKVGIDEIHRSLSKKAFMKKAIQYFPEIGEQDVRPGPSGVRAQAIDRYGNLVDDFFFEKRGSVLHCLNVPSPAATSSLAIGEVVAGKVLEEVA